MSLPVLLSTAYLPPIEYVMQCLRSPRVTIEQFETYQKQTYRNRCTIATANGLLQLSIPVKKVNGNHTLTKDIQIDHTGRWSQVHWRAIVSAYTHSPYFQYYRHHFEPLFHQPPLLLVEFNAKLLQIIFKVLKTPVEIDFTSDFHAVPDQLTDLRQAIHPKLSADYPGKPVSFSPYTQTFSNKYPFEPNLSIIDLLFNEGPASLDFL